MAAPRKNLLPDDLDYKVLFEALMDQFPEGITIARPPDARIVAVSKWGQSVAGQDQSALADIPAAQHPARWGVYRLGSTNLAAPEDLPLTRATLHGEIVQNEEWIILRPDGSKASVLCNAAPVRDSSGSIQWGIIAWRDVTTLRETERQLGEERRRALETKDLLLAETKHRVKNNLGIIASMLRLQSKTIKDAAAPEQFLAAAERVNVLCQLYDQLAHSDHQSVRARTYLSSLVRSVESAVWRPGTTVDIALEADDIELPSAVATDLGLVVNELLTNACKYGQGVNGHCNIKLSLKRDDRTMAMEVSDEGPGLPPTFDLSKSPSLGMRLVRALVGRYDGKFSWANVGGAHFYMSIPLANVR